MDIICDTNIWYNIGNGNIDTSTISSTDKLIGNYNNIDEFAGTTNLLHKYDVTKKAIQAMYSNSENNLILNPPFVHLIKIQKPNFKIDLSNHTDFMVEFTKSIAQGSVLIDKQKNEFKKICNERQQKLQNAADVMNIEAEKIRIATQNVEMKNRTDRIPSVRKLISSFASEQRGGEHLPKNFDWRKVELLENVLLDFYILLERGLRKMTANDWNDLFLLAYVQPGKKVWTKEKRWIKIINQAGMSKYLYNN